MFSPVYITQILGPGYQYWKKNLVEASCLVHRAHLVMLAKQGIVDSTIAGAIKEGIDLIEKDFQYPDRIPDNTEDLYFTFEKELGRRIGSANAGFLHTARSRNDMDAAIFRIFLRGRILEVLERLLDQYRIMDRRMHEPDGKDPFILYTHGQPANVSTLAHYISSMLLDTADCTELLCATLGKINISPMGACAITTTGFPIDREIVSRLLGFDNPITNSYGAIAVSHWLTFPAGALKLILLGMGRYIADISHKASCEVGILRFPDSLVQISSIMPQKRNPVILEHVRIQASLGMGILTGIEDLFRNVPFQDVNESGDAALAEISRAVDIVLSCISLFNETVQNISVVQERVYAVAQSCGITTTELADRLVRDFHISFREAHGITSAFVKSGYDKKVLRQKYQERGFGPLPYSDEEIHHILSPEEFIAARSVPGGPNQAGMESVYHTIQSIITGLEHFLLKHKSQLAAANTELNKMYGAL